MWTEGAKKDAQGNIAQRELLEKSVRKEINKVEKKLTNFDGMQASAKKSFPYMDIYACTWDKRWSQVWSPKDGHICLHDNHEKLYMV